MPDKQVIVVGAGAGGMMAAGRAAECGARVLLLEKMEQPAQKILISGKTRCNLTNARDLEDFIPMYGRNGKFLYSAFHRFFREDLLEFLHNFGVETKTERGGRVFPASGDARDIVRAFKQYLDAHNVETRTHEPVLRLRMEQGQITGVETRRGLLPARAAVVATGGASYPATGSTGDGYRLAEDVGHTIVKLRPSLVPLIVEEIDLVKSMQDVNLRNVRLTAYSGRTDRLAALNGSSARGPVSVIDSRMGEVLLTHFGLAGPITLQMSLSIVEALEQGPVCAAIDLKPALDRQQLQRRLQRDFDSLSKQNFRTILNGLLPLKLIEPCVKLSGIPADKPGNQINAAERDRLANLLKSLSFNIQGPLPMASALVTAGGISLKEIDPRTMASRLVKGLYFCGEVVDIQADTGGYNLQAAFSTGFVAGEAAANYSRTL